MNKEQFLTEIKRLSIESGGKSPGWQAFSTATGARKADWYPHVWLRWSDALSEAGLAPNEFRARVRDEVLLEKYIGLIRELGRLPIEGEVRRKAREDDSFPNHGAFTLRFGGKAKLLESLSTYCVDKPEYEDILGCCMAYRDAQVESRDAVRESKTTSGFVYLMKSGRHYKIGRTKSMGRRANELSIKIPVPPQTIHCIETDDPVGVEVYWHKRFAHKRGEGEWFNLSLDDVKAFKRWKRIF